jgi:Asp-tRNA(Asn)/Glu-tRNA(Gln) amidotransferase B subunit
VEKQVELLHLTKDKRNTKEKQMSKYEITLGTSEQDYITVVETVPMTLNDMHLTPGKLVETAVKQLNAEGVDLKEADVINASIRELDDYEEYLLDEGATNE